MPDQTLMATAVVHSDEASRYSLGVKKIVLIELFQSKGQCSLDPKNTGAFTTDDFSTKMNALSMKPHVLLAARTRREYEIAPGVILVRCRCHRIRIRHHLRQSRFPQVLPQEGQYS